MTDSPQPRRFRLTAAPFYRSGGRQHPIDWVDGLVEGAEVTASPDARPDSDGDLFVVLAAGGHGGNSVSAECLAEIVAPGGVSEEALRKAAEVLGVSKIDAVIAVARAIEEVSA
jgi:hypothetical protein